MLLSYEFIQIAFFKQSAISEFLYCFDPNQKNNLVEKIKNKQFNFEQLTEKRHKNDCRTKKNLGLLKQFC